jgi:hypothetical protein
MPRSLASPPTNASVGRRRRSRPGAAGPRRRAATPLSSRAEVERSDAVVEGSPEVRAKSWLCDALDPLTSRPLPPPTHPQKLSLAPTHPTSHREVLRGEREWIAPSLPSSLSRFFAVKAIRVATVTSAWYPSFHQKARLRIIFMSACPGDGQPENPLIPWCFWCLGGETGGWKSRVWISDLGQRSERTSFNLKNNATFALDVHI